ncbi:hypothetical protein HPP92_006164 [Vanilla planifolia]|uniref:Pentatricopeptide repeat-containing protein n=1 Tax=Vanilla planifolia TaxID=51239 RepID=A0A835RQ28_VANPL|nr:hypothetical protein HPP92_006164 [Vanilla planifolia]
MRTRDVASWTTLISTYTQTEKPVDAIAAFVHMLARPNDGSPNDYTYGAVLSACSALADTSIGTQIHAHAARRGIRIRRFRFQCARDNVRPRGTAPRSGGGVPRDRAKDLVSWSAVIAAHAQEGLAAESFVLFEDMRRHGGGKSTDYTLASLLSACACAAVLDAGRQAHARALAAGLEAEPMVTSALIAMYAKCGVVKRSRRCVYRCPAGGRRIVDGDDYGIR